MKTTLLIAASALTLAGCQGASHAVAKLDCPVTEGDLTRVSIEQDGKSCAYRSADGAEVSLELVPIVGDAQATLANLPQDQLDELENQVRALAEQNGIELAERPETV